MLYDCFISYSSLDLDLARRFFERLVGAGIPTERIWFDKERVKPGFDWHRDIEAACESSRVVLPLLTLNWKNSEWTRYETYGAENVIPLLAEGRWEEVATPPLTRYQAFERPFDETTRLAAAIRECCARPVERREEHVVVLDHVPSRHFLGREELMDEIHERLFVTPTAALTQGHIQAVTALGGVGKTTLARHYAEKFWRPYRQIFWIDCRAGLETGFARIYEKLHAGAEFAGLPQAMKAAWAREELRRPRRDLCLLILDNAENQDSVTPWLPQTGNVHTLITSRFTSWTGGIEKCEVWVLDKEPARELLMRSSGLAGTAGDTAEERGQADRVGKKLEYLPLALEQAAAYVRKQPAGFGFAGYLRLYGENERRMLEAGTKGATEYPASAFLTWKTTVDQLPEGARRILRMHAWVAPTPFPVTLYVWGAAEIDPGAREFEVREWVGALLEYSMALRAEGGGIRVHGLVQAVERHRAQEEGKAEEAYSSIRNLFSEQTAQPSWEPLNRRLWDVLLAHGEALCSHADLAAKSLDTRLSSKMGEAYRLRGDYIHAIRHYRDAVASHERLLGVEHPDTLTLLNNLAGLYYSQGEYAEAERLFQLALKARVRVLGAEHPDTVTSINNLAEVYRGQGRYPEAEPLFRDALEICDRKLGPNHPDTLTSVNNLAELYRSQGRYGAAEPLFRRAVAMQEGMLGADHPDALTSKSNLGGLYYSEGRYPEAESLLQQALEGRARSLGPEHPDTLTSVSDLANVYSKQGRYAESEAFHKWALARREQVLGAEHPSTLQSVNSLGFLYDVAERYGDAEPLHRRALEARQRVLGTDHPDTLQSMNNLALAYLNQRRFEDAEGLLHGALERMKRALGTDHPYTLASVNNFGLLYYNQGLYGDAEPLFGRALEGAKSFLGPDHPTTLLYARNHAACLTAMKKA